MIPGTAALLFSISLSLLLLRLIEFHALISRHRLPVHSALIFQKVYKLFAPHALRFALFLFSLFPASGRSARASVRILNILFGCDFFVAAFLVRCAASLWLLLSIKYLLKCPQVRFDLCFRFLTRFSTPPRPQALLLLLLRASSII